MDISIEMNLDRTYLIRQTFDILDLLSDVGGIQTIMVVFASVVVSVLNFGNFDTFLASRLYKIKRESATDDSKENIFAQSDYFRGSKCNNIKLCLMHCLPSKLVCCKRSYKERGIERAITAMQKETDIIEMIKSRRYLKLALRKLLTK